jgi:hypothetical protein
MIDFYVSNIQHLAKVLSVQLVVGFTESAKKKKKSYFQEIMRDFDDSMQLAFATYSKPFYNCLCQVIGRIRFKDPYKSSPRDTFNIDNPVCWCQRR